MPEAKAKETSNKHVQTTLHCFPHVLLSNSDLVKVFSDRSCQTATTTPPDTNNLDFYPALEFTPYQAIVQGCIRELDLPRRAFLQWKPPTFYEGNLDATSISSRLTERDDQGKQKGVLKTSKLTRSTSIAPSHHPLIMQKSMVNQEIQTTLSVAPHVLDSDEVANVFNELGIQTSITCLPNESISNVLPKLKANLSHASGMNEVLSVISKRQEATNTVEAELTIDEPAVIEEPEQSPEEPPEESHEEAEELEDPETRETETDDTVNTLDTVATESPPTLSITISTTQIHKTSCICGSRVLQQIAGQLRVQASTLKLTPKVFPPGARFEERMMEVLNTTIAALQTEIATLMEMYMEENKAACACVEVGTQHSLANINKLPTSCVCGAANAGFDDDQKEIRKIVATRKLMDPVTMKLSLIEENIVEEKTKIVILDTNSETIVEERIRTTTVRTKSPEPQTPKSCKCSKKNKKVAIAQTTNAPLEEESREHSKPVEEDAPPVGNYAPPDEEDGLSGEESEIEDMSISLAENEEVAPPAAEPEVKPEVKPPNPIEVPGDSKRNKPANFIPCECHPTAAGAAPGTLNETESPLIDNAGESEISLNACSCPESITDVANASVMDDEITDDIPSLAEDVTAAEKTLKFEILLKRGIKDVESASATSAIVVRATISCPSMKRGGKQSAQTAPSLPDLREQVIRLSVIYKNGPETRIEERLTPGHQIKIAPNLSQNPCTEKKAPISPNVQGITNGNVCECGKLACERRPSQIAYQQQHTYIEIEDVPFSSMPCPVHQNQRPPPCTCNTRSPPSAPSGRSPPSTVKINDHETTALEITISYGVCEEDSDKLRTESFMYEHETDYGEPYMAELAEFVDATTGVQTDISLGDKLESESLQSLVIVDEIENAKPCGSKTEIPWVKISLPAPGTYTIKPTSTPIHPSQQLIAEPVELDEPTGAVEGEDENAEVAEVAEGAEGADGAEAAPAAEPVPAAEPAPAAEPTPAVESAPAGEPAPDAESAAEGAAEGADDGGEGDVQEAAVVQEEPPQPTERVRKEPLLYEADMYKHNEPYMEGLYRAYPDSDFEDDGECGEQTEIPWKDILLPVNCKIRKVKKTKKCTCPGTKLSGMFIPTVNVPRKLEDCEDEFVIEAHLDFTGFNEPPSMLMPVVGGAASQQTLSYVSTVSSCVEQAKRVPKNLTLLVDLAKGSNTVSFQAGKGELQKIPMNASIGPTSSTPYSVSARRDIEGKNSSVIVDIKPSTECQFPSQRFPVFPGTPSTELNVINAPMYIGNMPTETKSCSTMLGSLGTGQFAGKCPPKTTASMPQVPSQPSVKATVSFKKLGHPDKVVTQTIDVVPGENLITLKVPDEPICVKLKMSVPKIPPEPAPSVQPQPQPQRPQAEVFSPGKCNCKDKVKLDTFRQDPVMAALEAYEAEMKPLRQALTQLQQKIRNLNMPEMKGCMCSTALQGPSAPLNTTVRSRIHVSAEPGFTTRTTMRVRPQSNANNKYGPEGTCPYFQPPGFSRPQSPYGAYGRLPPPALPPRHEPYMANPPNYSQPPGNAYNHNSCSCERGGSRHSRSNDHRGHSKGHRSHDRDIAAQGRNYGMYPDYRGRKYPDDQMAYQDSSCMQKSNHKRGRSSNHDTYKLRHSVSVHSSGNGTSDYDSQGVSDGEDLCPSRRNKSKEKSHGQHGHHGHKNKHSHKSSSKTNKSDNCSPCHDYSDPQQLRPGQALKTGPEEFLKTSSRSSKKHGCSNQNSSNFSVPQVTSKTKIQIKFPR